MSRWERKAAGLGVEAFLWLALIGVAFAIDPIIGYIWTAFVFAVTVFAILTRRR